MDLFSRIFSRKNMDAARTHAATVGRFAVDHRMILGILVIAFSLFYWYEVRPIRVHRACAVQASTDARSLLVSKAKITADQAKRASYAQMADNNMYLRTDYESFYSKCLRHYAMDDAE